MENNNIPNKDIKPQKENDDVNPLDRLRPPVPIEACSTFTKADKAGEKSGNKN